MKRDILAIDDDHRRRGKDQGIPGGEKALDR
jgi:hypothetical protein